MNADSKDEIEELCLEAQEVISGGTEPDFQYVEDLVKKEASKYLAES